MRVPTILPASLSLIVVCLGLSFVGCGNAQQEQANQAVDSSGPVMAAESTGIQDAQLATTVAEHLIARFSTRLRTELMTAVDQHGAAGAIGVCKTIAPLVADSLSQEGWTIRRVALRNRSEENAATETQAEQMQQFSQDTSLACLTSWSTEAGVSTFQYAKPIVTQPLCTKCHGPRESLAPDVLAAIDKEYPNDKAVGFAVGDLRGMFVVTVEWPRGKALAEKLAAEATTAK